MVQVFQCGSAGDENPESTGRPQQASKSLPAHIYLQMGHPRTHLLQAEQSNQTGCALSGGPHSCQNIPQSLEAEAALNFAVIRKSLLYKNIVLRLWILELPSLDKNVYKSCTPLLALRAEGRLPGRDHSSLPTPWSSQLGVFVPTPDLLFNPMDSPSKLLCLQWQRTACPGGYKALSKGQQ